MIISAPAGITPVGRVADIWLRIEGGIIREIGTDSKTEADLKLSGTLIPAFVDIHCHGGGGKYFSEDASTARAVHRKNGTQFQFASLVTASLDDLISQISLLKDNPEISGIHLEGPYLSPLFKGAHAEKFLRTPSLDEIKRLLEAGEGAIRMVTIAPELDGAISAIEFLVDNNVIVAIGHSAATADQAQIAIDAGASVVTHLNNAMTKIGKSDSLLQAALDSDIQLELIHDGMHVDEETMKSFYEIVSNRIVAVTDAMSAAGCGDGSYSIGDLDVDVRDGRATLAGTNTLAGSTLTMLDAFLNINTLVGFEQAVLSTSILPSRIAGVETQVKYIGIKGHTVTYL